MKTFCAPIAVVACLAFSAAFAQEKEAEPAPELNERAEDIVEDTREKVEEISKQVDEDERAKEASAGILKPIYLLAEFLAFPAFHWVAFTIMVAGVVSFALQLVLAKLVVLSKLGFSFTEFLSDGLGLAISLVGLVLTTQAAAENSTFTESPFSVLSATVVGALSGFIFYRWGQSQEVQAVEGRKKQTTKPEKA